MIESLTRLSKKTEGVRVIKMVLVSRVNTEKQVSEPMEAQMQVSKFQLKVYKLMQEFMVKSVLVLHHQVVEEVSVQKVELIVMEEPPFLLIKMGSRQKLKVVLELKLKQKVNLS